MGFIPRTLVRIKFSNSIKIPRQLAARRFILKKSTKTILENFNFKCTLCGECCRGDMNVYLNIYDLYKLSKFMGYTKSEDLFDNRLVELGSGQNGIMMPKIKFKQSTIKFCPFLENELTDTDELLGKCKLHPQYKPLICSLSPVARQIDMASGKIEHWLVEPAPGCPGMDQSKINKLSSVLRDLDTELEFEKRYYTIWDSIKSGQSTSIYKEKMIYFFPTDIPFEKTLAHFERQFS